MQPFVESLGESATGDYGRWIQIPISAVLVPTDEGLVTRHLCKPVAVPGDEVWSEKGFDRIENASVCHDLIHPGQHEMRFGENSIPLIRRQRVQALLI